MYSKHIMATVVAASVAFGGTQPAFADGDALVGGIIGGIIGGAIVNEVNKGAKTKRRTTSTRSSSSGQTSAQREANREVQVALNHFNFPVGTPDGQIGPRSRAAISEYQATLGYPATGQLTEYERSHLVTSYHRAIAGGPLTMQQAAASPMGMRGLLVTWRDESLGVTPPAATAVVDGSNSLTTEPEIAAPVEMSVVEAPMAAASDPAATALPNFLGTATSESSLASHCNKVSLRTSTNGGYTTVATMSDPMQALAEQFCLARGYSIALGEDLAGQVQGFTPEQIAQQCEGFGPAMQAHIAALSLKSAADVAKDVESFALSTGMAPTQLAGTAKICLSVGYRNDNMDVAVASALILATLGDGAYGELLGHHLSQGFGTTQRPDLALAWYEQGLAAAAMPTGAVFAPDQPDRLELVRKAALIIGGKPEQAALPEAAPVTLPSFKVPESAEASEIVVEASPIIPAASGPQVTATSDVEDAAAGPVNALYGVARLPLLIFGN